MAIWSCWRHSYMVRLYKKVDNYLTYSIMCLSSPCPPLHYQEMSQENTVVQSKVDVEKLYILCVYIRTIYIIFICIIIKYIKINYVLLSTYFSLFSLSPTWEM